jgi:polyisoprenoid-binding protein YceI
MMNGFRAVPIGSGKGASMKSISTAILALWTVTTVWILPGRAAAEVLEIRPGKPNLVVFRSQATLETFEGKTRQVSGTVRANLGNLVDSVDVMVEVDLASLDTGIGLRNKHMREDHLQTGQYPKAVFLGKKLLEPSQPSIAPGEKVTCRIAGDFSLHGITRPVEVPVVASMPAGSGRISLHVLGRFDVKLSDYEIPRPSFLVMRLDETQHVTIDITAFGKD